MADTPEYTPPKVWSWNKPNSTMGRFANINRPTAGAQHDKELPVGKHPLQLYSQGTPNGVKVTVMRVRRSIIEREHRQLKKSLRLSLSTRWEGPQKQCRQSIVRPRIC